MDCYIPGLPRKILVQKGSIENIKEFSSGFGKEFLIVADNITKKLGAEKMQSELGGDLILISDSTLDEVKKVERSKADCIISFGGGKVIDVGKLAAHNKKVPFISCPTTCSNDGIASANASITVDGKYTSFNSSSPVAVIADLNLISKSPYRLLASGAADVLSNYTAIADWKIASKNNKEAYNPNIAQLALFAADIVCNNSKKIKNLEEDGLKTFVWSLIFSGMSMSLHNSSRPASGAEHMFSHALDKIGNFGLHGEQVGIGTIFFSYLHGSGWGKIKNTLKEIEAPTNIKEINLDKETFIQAMLEAKDIRKRYTILDEKPLNKEIVLKIAAETGII